ncbi:hypothetical protein [Adhaeribacter radiodurans]|uniref:Uncharacterized protein n=1 Tax=Adhaeribacter radiodurans TaxID=2745197 RepID=A0A7L7LAH2_9BACT|nr:hypothetical protein [Adhaeribacter radiodurans]QMU29820.1 hypothetical protein HUW48_18115 [Adhaeribacter radiodurans]
MFEPSPEETNIGKPPFFKSWNRMYWLVIVSLAVQVLVFYLITQAYK